ncbi:DUF397 domain-containing protein [Streptomyces sp. NBC_00572]|uniref:DUF397 domain-containing protein n=1 Tax=Streptomyces sp. NBC_00572 TaxID=2903664 RepID=UPI00224DB821|nr:DUF397 domain-containing protein [Streptomyces sp. NBC_00572]MCX4982693.1 DUF397 domain-containing protein [Streptomyces sp. NBC_00572]
MTAADRESRAANHRRNTRSLVEVPAGGASQVHVRDSKNPHGPRLAVAPTAWAAFVVVASGA